MRKFNISVNGSTYEVEVEEVKDGSVSQPSVRIETPKAVVAPAPKAVAVAAAPASVPAGASTVVSPMPGTILKIEVRLGDVVKKGDVLCILEAMKMENEIMTGRGGKIATIAVNAGDSVSTGQLLFALE